MISKVTGFQYTTAVKKLRKLSKRIKCVPGGTSAGKTYSILPILIDKACRTPLLEISVVSESVPHLRRGAMKDFLKIMKVTGRYIDQNWNRTMSTYRFANGSFIEFFSVAEEEKVRGPRRNILYINESNNIPFDTYHQLAIRTSDEIWLDWNPSNTYWAYDELADDEDAEWLTLTYADNEALSESIVKEIEKARDKAKTSSYWDNWWKVYGLGQLGSLEGVIFNNYKIIDTLPPDARLLGYGIDWGFTNDPTAIVAVYTWNGKRILHEICYRTGLLNADIARFIPDKVTCYADSAEPKSIAEMRHMGKSVYPTMKGKDSINYGIQLMQQQDYLITTDSTNVIKEFRAYCWDKDKLGKTLNKPIDSFNHAIDGIRYHEMMTLGRKKQEFFITTI